MLDLRLSGRGFEPHWRHCVVSLSKNNNPCIVLIQPRKTRAFITERLLMRRRESNQTEQKYIHSHFIRGIWVAIAPPPPPNEAFSFLYHILHVGCVDSPVIMWIQNHARGGGVRGHAPPNFFIRMVQSGAF